ncbi:MAG TPA: ABC transporter permease [Thermomicrobiaceae bacterium]|nr:ABC transporter permease [Thermomicrobiaceae bacterium]
MRLRYYVLRRVLLFIPVLIGLSIVTFVISHIVPGDPVGLAAGPGSTPDQIEALRRQFGMDQPLPIQYLRYMANLLHGDLGASIMSRHTVTGDLRVFFPNTLELVIVSMVIAVCIGIPLGVVSAVWRDRWPDQLSRVFALGSISVPSFWLAIVLQILLAMSLHLLPVGGIYDARATQPVTHTGFLLIDTLIDGDPHAFLVTVEHLILPAVTLALGPIAFIMRILRADVLETLNSDWVKMLRANGVPERVILFKYVLKHSLIATVSVIGFIIGYSLGGSVVIETVFDWPGVGLYAVNSALALDFQPVMGVTLMIGLIFLVVNLLTDLTYGVLDPRIRFG